MHRNSLRSIFHRATESFMKGNHDMKARICKSSFPRHLSRLKLDFILGILESYESGNYFKNCL